MLHTSFVSGYYSTDVMLRVASAHIQMPWASLDKRRNLIGEYYCVALKITFVKYMAAVYTFWICFTV